MTSAQPPLRTSLVAAALVASLAGCPTVNSPESNRPPEAQKWYLRAQEGFKACDVEDAHDSIKKALAMVPQDPDIKTLAASIALARLDYAEVIRLLPAEPRGKDKDKDARNTVSARLRGRALWYKGDLDAAADEIESVLNDPEVKDDWAKSISKLARAGAGRTPFALSGSLLAAEELVHVNPNAPLFIVQVDIDGEPALAMIETGRGEVVLDSATRPEPSWVSLRFAQRLEVHDVPAVAEDLTGISKQLGAPIKALLGVNLLRHLNVTLDYEGRQFVARTYAPPPPPNATRVDLCYAQGGGMVMKSSFGKGAIRAALHVDTGMGSPLALDEGGWKKAGVELGALKVVPGDASGKLKEGVVGLVRIGAFEVQQVPAEYGVMPIGEVEKTLGIDLDGIIGAGLLAHYRLTFGDDGRTLWMEDDSAVERMLNGGVNQPPPVPGASPLLIGPQNQALPPPAATTPPAPPKKDK